MIQSLLWSYVRRTKPNHFAVYYFSWLILHVHYILWRSMDSIDMGITRGRCFHVCNWGEVDDKDVYSSIRKWIGEYLCAIINLVVFFPGVQKSIFRFRLICRQQWRVILLGTCIMLKPFWDAGISLKGIFNSARKPWFLERENLVTQKFPKYPIWMQINRSLTCLSWRQRFVSGRGWSAESTKAGQVHDGRHLLQAYVHVDHAASIPRAVTS
jgi:hypothetical protein